MITGLHRWLSAVADDPLGPVVQDPDLPRNLACDLTASQRVCFPAAPERPDPPDVDLSDAAALAGGGSIVSTLLVVVLVVALIASMVWLVVVLLRERRSRDDDDSDTDDDADEDLDADELPRRIVDDERPPQRWRRLAQEHRDAGEFRDAVRCEFRALVGDLARAGIVDEIPGRTSGEERAQLRRLAGSVAPVFDEAADIFDRAWFDDPPITAEVDEWFRGAAQRVLDDVRGVVAARR